MSQTQELEKYPEWYRDVEEAKKMPALPLDYKPEVVEIFDQFGLLCGVAFGVAYECDRITNSQPSDITSPQKSEFIAWYLDGKLALFYTESEILVNRLESMATAALFLENLEEV